MHKQLKSRLFSLCHLKSLSIRLKLFQLFKERIWESEYEVKTIPASGFESLRMRLNLSQLQEFESLSMRLNLSRLQEFESLSMRLNLFQLLKERNWVTKDRVRWFLTNLHNVLLIISHSVIQLQQIGRLLGKIMSNAIWLLMIHHYCWVTGYSSTCFLGKV